MGEPLERQRAFLFAAVDGTSDTETVAGLLEQAAARLRDAGPVVVQAVTFEHDGVAQQASVTLTVYYDRVERRRVSRR